MCSSDLSDRLRQIGKTFLRSQRHDNLCFGVQLDSESPRVISRLGTAKARNALGRGIAVGAGLPRHFAQLFNHMRSEEHTSELQSLMRSAYAVFCLKKNNKLYAHNMPPTDGKQQHTTIHHT